MEPSRSVTSTGRMWKFASRWERRTSFLFGKTTEEIEASGMAAYRPWDLNREIPRIAGGAALDQARSFPANGDVEFVQAPCLDNLNRRDPFLPVRPTSPITFAPRTRFSGAWAGTREQWKSMSLLNSARKRPTSPLTVDPRVRQRIWQADCLPVTISCAIDGDGDSNGNSDSIGRA